MAKKKQMTASEVAALMRSSKNEAEWNANSARVKQAFGGVYPGWWWSEIMLSGLFASVQTRWVTGKGDE